MSNDPATVPAESRKISVLLKIYGVYCLITAVAVLALIALIAIPLAQYGADLFRERHDVTLTMTLVAVQLVTMFLASVGYVAFGVLVLKNRRRHVAQITYGLIGVGIVNLILEIMLNGFGDNLIYDGVRLVVLLVISATIDPTLITERQLQRRLRDMETEKEAEAGTLGRAKGDRGFIELDFFNLFWVFVVCCFLGLVIETVYHMVVVDPGVYQDRAGMLYGPFSPIYGFGAVLMTVALNRFYRANPVVIFLVSAVVGGLFEAAVSWFMQVGFGAVAWDYSGSTIFGLFPDPIAVLFQGRTSTLHVHVGRAGVCLDQGLPTVAAQAHQPHPLAGALLLHHGLRNPDAGQRRHDAAVPRVLVPARERPSAHLTRRGVLRRALRRRLHGAPFPVHDDHARGLRPRVGAPLSFSPVLLARPSRKLSLFTARNKENPFAIGKKRQSAIRGDEKDLMRAARRRGSPPASG